MIEIINPLKIVLFFDILYILIIEKINPVMIKIINIVEKIFSKVDNLDPG